MLRACAETGLSFKINEQDLALLAKISPKVDGRSLVISPPTLCPGARERRRLSWRNERTLYRRQCPVTGDSFISIYAPASPYNAVGLAQWYSDSWDATTFGREFDFDRPFFEQFEDLLRATPLIPLLIGNCENSDYTNYSLSNKDSYMIAPADYNERCFHSAYIFRSRDCGDCFFVSDSELCYECIDCINCYEVLGSQCLRNCHTSLFCYDCRSCSNCIGCYGLRNKEYYVCNEPVSKETFEEKKESILRSWSRDSDSLVRASLDLERTHSLQENCEDCEGTSLVNCKNCYSSHDLIESQDCRYVRYGIRAVDCLDGNGIPNGELLYECTAVPTCKRSAFCASCWDGSYELFYSYLCRASNNCFGCVSLHRKQFCILNRQYTEVEYYQLLQRIIEHMSRTGEWGEFFPVGSSPFAYNETAAMNAFPLPKEEIEAIGGVYRNIDQARDQGEDEKAVLASDVVPDEQIVIKSIFKCIESSKPYRIVKPELDFYIKLGVPLPTLHPDVRHRRRIKLRDKLNSVDAG